jgi:hypothetical protein
MSDPDRLRASRRGRSAPAGVANCLLSCSVNSIFIPICLPFIARTKSDSAWDTLKFPEPRDVQ